MCVCCSLSFHVPEDFEGFEKVKKVEIYANCQIVLKVECVLELKSGKKATYSIKFG